MRWILLRLFEVVKRISKKNIVRLFDDFFYKNSVFGTYAIEEKKPQRPIPSSEWKTSFSKKSGYGFFE
jgi:hypothetical protein